MAGLGMQDYLIFARERRLQERSGLYFCIVSVPYCFDYCSFVVYSEIMELDSFALFFPKIALAVLEIVILS